MKKLLKTCISLIAILILSTGYGKLIDDWVEQSISSRIPVAKPERVSAKSKSMATIRNTNDESFLFEMASSNICCEIPDDALISYETIQENDQVGMVRFSSNGIDHVFLAQTRFNYSVPYAYFATGYNALSVEEDICKRVKSLFCRDVYRLYSIGDVLNSSEVSIWSTLPRAKISVPWRNFRMFVIDDKPGANWGHPCRYVLCDETATSFVVYFRHGLPQVKRNADIMNLELICKTDKIEDSDFSDILNSVTQLRSDLKVSCSNLDFSGDLSHSYFVIICGGGEYYMNGIRFWADAAAMYSTLRLKYGVPASQIYAYVCDGFSSDRDATLSDESGPFVSSPTDLDGDGVSDIRGAATRDNIRNVFSTLASQMTTSDQVMIFLTSHGGPDSSGGEYDAMCCLTGDEEMTDDELASWTRDINCPVAYAIETCYSGGFIDDVVQYGRRMMATACRHDEYSWGRSGMGYWGDEGIGATCAYNYWAMPFTAAFRGYKPDTTNFGFPWNDAASVDADANDDGYVSFYEAQAYAKNADTADESPQFDENPSGAASNFFIYKNPHIVRIYFNPNGGRVATESQEYAKGQMFGGFPVPTRSGWVFTGWYTYSGMLVTCSSFVPSYSTTLYAGWSPQVGIAAALDCPDFAFSASSWRGQQFDSADGVDAMRTISIGHNQSAILSTRVVGPGRISFKWKVSSEGNYDKLSIKIGEEVVESISGEVDWRDCAIEIPAGTHDISWVYSKDGSLSRNQDCGWVDCVRWTPAVSVTFRPTGGSIASPTAYYFAGSRFGSLPRPSYYGHVFVGWYTRATGGVLVTPSSVVPSENTTYYAHWAPVVSLSAALDAPSLGFSSSGWKGQLGESYDSVDSARSAPADHNMSSVLRTEFSGKGRISFWWKCSSERGGDRLRLVIDGVQLAVISGETTWQKLTINLSSGSHEVKWVYSKNGSITAGQDCGWVDRVEWIPEPVVVSFDGNGGRLTTSSVVYHDGVMYGDLPIPVRSGYVFLGWYTDPYSGYSVNSSSTASVSVTRLYARYCQSLSLDYALDSEGAVFYTDGWEGQSDSYEIGGAAARSKPISHDGSTYMYTRVYGKGTVSFRWKVSSEGGGRDSLRFLVDGVQHASIAGEGATWQTFSVRLTSQTSHVLKWVYAKNSSVSKGDDCGWVDDLRWEPEVSVSLFAAGGSVGTSSVIFKIGSLFGALPTPTRSGHVFVGWRDQYGRVVDASTRVSSDISSLTAQWSPIVSLSAALDAPALNFYTDGWKGQQAESYDGVDAARSAPIGHGKSSTLYTRVIGAGTISFCWKVSCEGSARDKLRLMIDGEQIDVVAGECDWRNVEVHIDSPGTHVIRWVYSKNASVVKGADAAWVDQVQWTPDPISLQEALDNVNLNLDTGAASWNGVGPGLASDGEDCAQSARIGNNATSWMQTTVSGSGQLEFFWKVSSASGDYLRLIVDGVQYDAICGTGGDWMYYSVWLLDGEHTIKWAYTKNASGSAGSDCGWVDQVSWSGNYSQEEELTFYTSGNEVWYIDDGVFYSGDIDDSQNTRLYTTVTGPGTISFDWSVSSESTYDILSFYLDGDLQHDISGEVSWTRMSVCVPSGTHEVEWIYSKDGSVDRGSDCGMVRAVTWSRTCNGLLDMQNHLTNENNVLNDGIYKGSLYDKEGVFLGAMKIAVSSFSQYGMSIPLQVSINIDGTEESCFISLDVQNVSNGVFELECDEGVIVVKISDEGSMTAVLNNR